MNEPAKARLLVADDDELSLRIIGDLLTGYGYAHVSARDGAEAVEKAKEMLPDLIFLDIVMPGMDGFEACRRLRGYPPTAHTPIIIVTTLTDKETRLKALDLGATDFLTKPVDPLEVMVRTRNLLELKKFGDFLKSHNETLDAEVKRRTAQIKRALLEVTSANESLKESRKIIKDSYIDTVHKLTIIAEYRDNDTALHLKRVGYLCAHLATSLGWPEDEIETIFYASPMHDIGKVAIPSDILLKPEGLTAEEFALMKTHTAIGADILKGSVSRILHMAERIALGHHERWDGKGYPAGLRGEDVPLEANVMNIVDQYDALRSHRPYKLAYSHQKALGVITKGDGRTMPSHFNPILLEAFKDNHREFARIYDEHGEPPAQADFLPRT
ncbi:MAG: response regulator [Deltaproteobacteria bacterium]|nr:response regulator [Deltaproteobacteria bacterium]